MFTKQITKYSADIESLGYYKSNHRLSLKYLQEPEWSDVKTKCVKAGQWKGLSLLGYSDDPNDLSKPNVLGHRLKSIWGKGGMDNWTKPTQIFDMKILSSITKIVKQFSTRQTASILDRVRLLKIEPNAIIKKHTDKVDKDFLNKEFPLQRYHVPIKTNPDAVMTVYGDEEVSVHMKENHLYRVDVTKPHSVVNGNEERIHLVIDAFNSENKGCEKIYE